MLIMMLLKILRFDEVPKNNIEEVVLQLLIGYLLLANIFSLQTRFADTELVEIAAASLFVAISLVLVLKMLKLQSMFGVFTFEKGIVITPIYNIISKVTMRLDKWSQLVLVISGINQEPSFGHLMLYSGVVAVAREALLCDVPSLSILLNWKDDKGQEMDFKDAVAFCLSVITAAIRGILTRYQYEKDSKMTFSDRVLTALLREQFLNAIDAQCVVIDAALDQSGKWGKGELLRAKAKLHIAFRRLTCVVKAHTFSLVVLEAGKQVHAVSQKLWFYDDRLVIVYSNCGKMKLSDNVATKLVHVLYVVGIKVVEERFVLFMNLVYYPLKKQEINFKNVLWYHELGCISVVTSEFERCFALDNFALEMINISKHSKVLKSTPKVYLAAETLQSIVDELLVQAFLNTVGWPILGEQVMSITMAVHGKETYHPSVASLANGEGMVIVDVNPFAWKLGTTHLYATSYPFNKGSLLLLQLVKLVVVMHRKMIERGSDQGCFCWFCSGLLM